MRIPGRILSPWDWYAVGTQSFGIPQPHYDEDSIPLLHGQVIIVTGANTGIGLQTTRVLLNKGAKVYVAARSPEKAKKAIAALEQEIPAAKREDRIEYLELDLADLRKVRKAAKEFAARENRLDVLFNSGGVMYPPTDQKTADGYDLQFGTNVLGHFAFTTALLPLLISTAKKSDTFPRVVNVASVGHVFAPYVGIPFDNMNMDSFLTYDRYHVSKLGNVLFGNELARRYRSDDVFSASLNPGNIRTELTRHVSSQLDWVIERALLYPVQLGAITQLYVGTAPELTMHDSGSYFAPWARKVPTNHPKAQDEEVARKLWEWCAEQVEKVTGEKAVPA